MVAVDVLNPCRKPSDGVVVDDLFPVATDVGLRYGSLLPDVDRNIFWTYSKL